MNEAWRSPVLILNRDSILNYLGEVTIAPITSSVRDIPSEVPLSQNDGMPRICAVNLDHIQTVPKAKLESMLTLLSRNKLEEVSEAIRFALNLE